LGKHQKKIFENIHQSEKTFFTKILKKVSNLMFELIKKSETIEKRKNKRKKIPIVDDRSSTGPNALVLPRASARRAARLDQRSHGWPYRGELPRPLLPRPAGRHLAGSSPRPEYSQGRRLLGCATPARHPSVAPPAAVCCEGERK
jgi:hypothetical protein